MVFYIIFIIASICQTYEFFLLYRCLLGTGEIFGSKELTAWAVLFFVSSIMYFLVNIPILTALATYGCLLIIARVIYGEVWKKAIIVSVFAFVNMTLAECFVALISGYVSLNVFQSQTYSSLWGISCLPIGQYLIVLLTRNFKNVKTGKEVPALYWFTTVLLPLLSLYLSILVFSHPVLKWYSIIGSTCAILGINFLVFYLYDHQLESLRVQHEKEILEERSRHMDNQLEMMKQINEQLQCQRHDFLKHISTLSYLSKSGQSLEVDRYLEKMAEQTNVGSEYITTGNKVLDYILNYKKQESIQKSISMEIRINIPDDLELSMSFYDITTIMVNLLDNAIEASAMTEDKAISVEISYSKKRLKIYIANSYLSVKKDNDGIYLTQKDMKAGHGFGLKNVRKVVEKYEGLLEMSEINGRFVTVAVLLVD